MELEKGFYITATGLKAELWGQTDDGIWWGNVNGKLEAWKLNGESAADIPELDLRSKAKNLSD